MKHYYEAYVFNESYRKFEDHSIKLIDLFEISKKYPARWSLIHNNLYFEKIYQDKYRLVLEESRLGNPYLRRLNASYFRRMGFSSECESELHNDFKNGLAATSVLKLDINNDKYYIHKKESYCERYCEHMGFEFETDCEYVFDDGDELYEVLKHNVISFEIHHTSPVNEKKGLSYALDREVIIEVDINDMLKYFPVWARVKGKAKQDRIRFIKEYLEDTDKHYIKASVFWPYESDLKWIGRESIAEIPGEENIRILVFEKYGEWRIIYTRDDDKPVYDNDYFGHPIKKEKDAKSYAAYRIQEHINGNKKLF